MATKTQNTTYDVLIVGAGPSGTASAITLAKLGHSVLLIDQHPFPRDKVCGDVLTGSSIRLLNELGVWGDLESKVNKIPAVEFYQENSNPLTLDISFYTLKRRNLDTFLLDHAIAHGAEFEVLRFTGTIERKGDTSICETKSSNAQVVKIKAKYVLLAVGCQTPYVFNTNKRVRLKKPDLMAVRGYYYSDWNIDHLLVHFSEKYANGGFLWIFPMGNNEYNVGCGTKSYQKVALKKTLDKFISEFSKKTNTSGHWISTPKGAFLRTSLSNLKYAVVDNILLTGETLGSSLPMTGEGIGMALETGLLASRTIHKALIKKDTSLLKGYKKGIKKGLKIKYLLYRMGESVIRTNNGYLDFRFNALNKIFFSLSLRYFRFINRICVKLSNFAIIT